MERKEIEEKLKNLLRLYTNSIKDYELESRGSIGQDERESMEFVEIFIDSEDEFGYNDILESLSGNSDKEAKPLFELKQDESGHVEMHIIEEDKLDFKAVPYIISEVKEELPTNEWISVKDQLPEPHNDGYWLHGVKAFFVMPDGSKHNQSVQWCASNRFIWHGMDITQYTTYWQEESRPPKPETVETKEQEKEQCDRCEGKPESANNILCNDCDADMHGM